MVARSSVRAALLLLAVLVLSSCGSFGFRQPEVTLDGVQLGGLGLRGGTLLVNLRVVNPNRFALNAQQLRYDLFLGDSEEAGDTTWIDFASGTYTEPFSVAARDTATVQIPVEFTYSGLGGAASSILRSGSFDYRASGTVDVQTPLGTRTVPFRKKGTVAMMAAR